jgi:hypothetical protein
MEVEKFTKGGEWAAGGVAWSSEAFVHFLQGVTQSLC